MAQEMELAVVRLLSKRGNSCTGNFVFYVMTFTYFLVSTRSALPNEVRLIQNCGGNEMRFVPPVHAVPSPDIQACQLLPWWQPLPMLLYIQEAGHTSYVCTLK